MPNGCLDFSDGSDEEEEKITYQDSSDEEASKEKRESDSDKSSSSSEDEGTKKKKKHRKHKKDTTTPSQEPPRSSKSTQPSSAPKTLEKPIQRIVDLKKKYPDKKYMIKVENRTGRQFAVSPEYSPTQREITVKNNEYFIILFP